MKIDKHIELPGGSVHFVGELSDEELDSVITLGLAMMLYKGMLPIAEEYDEETLQ